MQPPFKVGAPLHFGDPSYIERDAKDGNSIEGYLCDLLMAPDPPLIKVIEPRQQGKTSLLMGLQKRLKGYVVVYLDASTISAAGRDDWYTQIGRTIHESITSQGIDARSIPGPPVGSSGWSSFLNQLARGNQKTVVVLDEAGAIRFEGSDHFFSCIRSLTTIDCKKLTFVLCGCFFASELVRNKNLSPFNVAREVRLPDFTEKQVRALLDRRLPDQPDWCDAQALAERIYYWTAGQPYLTQLLCGSLRRPDAAPEDVDKAAGDCLRNEGNHFEGIRGHLREDPAMASYLCEVIAGKKERMISYDPGDVRSRLWLLGLVKEKERSCVVKNRIYEDAFRCLPHSYDFFISYRHKDSPSYLPDLLSVLLEKKNKSVFLDKMSLNAERFEPHILSAIEAAPYFILILSPGCLDRCGEPGDWYAREIIHAIEFGRKIFIIAIEGFALPSQMPPNLPPKIAELLAEENWFTLNAEANPQEVVKKIVAQFVPFKAACGLDNSAMGIR